MLTDTRNLVSVSEVSQNASRVIARAEAGERLVIMRNTKPTAIIVDMETADRMSKIEEIEEDLKLLTASLVRMATDNGRRYDLDDIAAELGINLDSDEME